MVELKGEAYFEVQADKDRPFYVNTPNGLSVYVYGTKFNVAAYEDDNYIETVLEKGKVNVITPRSGNNSIGSWRTIALRQTESTVEKK